MFLENCGAHKKQQILCYTLCLDWLLLNVKWVIFQLQPIFDKSNSGQSNTIDDLIWKFHQFSLFCTIIKTYFAWTSELKNWSHKCLWNCHTLSMRWSFIHPLSFWKSFYTNNSTSFQVQAQIADNLKMHMSKEKKLIKIIHTGQNLWIVIFSIDSKDYKVNN